MTLLKIFWAFFISNILGYGGGPATIPLIQQQVVDQYNFMTNEEFANVLAVANALPGPIATKLASFIGYEEAGVIGVIIANIATIAPSAIAIILLLRVVNHFKESKVIAGMTGFIQPVIAVLMLQITFDFWSISVNSIGNIQSIIIGLVSLLAIGKFKIHPAIVILIAFVYGAISNTISF